MKKVRVYLSIGYSTAMRRDELEFEDDATEEEIEREVHEWAMEYVEWGFEEMPE